MYLGNVSYDFINSTVTWAGNHIAVDKLTKKRYDMEEAAGLVTGISKELRAKKLVQMLDGVKEVRLAKSGSVMDVKLKADVAVEFEDGRCGIFQVKSSKAGAITHMTKSDGEIEYNNDVFEIPGVYWFEDGLSNVDALQELAEFLNTSINPKLVAALAACETFNRKGYTLPLPAVRQMFPAMMFEWLLFLRKIHVEQARNVRFI